MIATLADLGVCLDSVLRCMQGHVIIHAVYTNRQVAAYVETQSRLVREISNAIISYTLSVLAFN